jgi:hypothetical protein
MNEQEKNRSIEYILDHGLVTPLTARERIAEMTRTLGLRFIFWDTGYSILFAAVTLAAILALFCIVPSDYRCSAAVAAAPLLFLLITLFAETSERACGLYELKQTCRYTVRQITALRVMCYSAAGAAFSAVIAAISAESSFEFLSLLPLCLSALFVCAAVALSVLRFVRGQWANAIFSALWVFANIALPFALGKQWETALRGAPIALSVALAAVGAVILAYQISKMLSEVKTYAHA